MNRIPPSERMLICVALAACLAATASAGDITADNITGYGKLEMVKQDPGSMSTNGLLLYYPFDEDLTNSVADDSGNGNTGAVNGATWTSSGKLGGGMSFDGVNDDVEADSLIDDISSLTVGTIAMWFKAEETAVNTALGICREASSPPHSSIRILAQVQSGYNVHMLARADSGWKWRVDLDTGSIVADTWYHLVVTHDGTEPSFYIDGEVPNVSWSTTTDKTAWFKAVLTDASSPADTINIGMREYGSTDTDHYKGDIDEVAFYNRALSSNEVYNLYRYADPPGEGAGTASFDQGITYTKELGDLSMGVYTNN